MTVPVRKAPLPLEYLIARGRQLLLLNQEELADLIGSSKRTVQRWETNRGTPAPWHLHKLADTVRSKDPEIAAQLDAWAPRPAAPPPAEPPRATEPTPIPPAAPEPPLPDHVLVESVVCAAAEALAVAPQAARPAVLAAFRRAVEARLTPAAVVAVLAPPEPPAPEAASQTPPRARRR